MLVSLSAVLTSASLTLYPAFGDRVPQPRAERTEAARIEAVIDKGPILELIVRCPAGSAILSYSKIERLYCGPRHGCDRALAAVVGRTCG